MPISRAQAEQAAEKAHEGSYNALYQRIDDALVHNAGTTRPTTFAASLLPYDMPTDRVITEYSRAGWKVRLVLDQRDGDYLEFT